MDYHQDTQELIERMCRNIERKDFRLQKKKAEELILQTYDLFNLPRPKKVTWCVDIFEDVYQKVLKSAWSAWSARSAGSAWSARSAGSAESAVLAWSAGSAGSARSSGSARSAGSAVLARSAESAESAVLARLALDYDFDWYVFEFEYCKNPDDKKLPNENDAKYLAYCELLMQAKEAGLGYCIEWKDTLYLVPTPLVLIDEKNNFHSLEKPAIRWKGGKEFYFLWGVAFEKELWQEVVDKSISALEVTKLQNTEQRYAALKVFGAKKLLTELNAELLDKSDKGNELYGLEGIIENQTIKMLKYVCPSTGRVYTKFVPFEITKADEGQSWSFGLTLGEYLSINAEA